MENRKINFFKKVFIAIKDFEQYKDFAIESIGSTVRYFIKLMLLFSMIISIGLTVKINMLAKSGFDYIKADIPEFKITDGKLEINADKPIHIENENLPLNMIIISTTENEEEIGNYIKEMKAYRTGVLFLKEKIILKYTFSEMEATDTGYYYRDIGLSDITKSQLLEKYTVTNMIYISFIIFIVTVIYSLAGYIILELIYTMFLAMIGYIVSRIFRVPLKFTAAIHLAVYSMTLPILLNAVYIIINMFTGFEIEYFTVMCMAISYIYMITAILLIKSDFIKRNIELTAIIEEQQKVKEEMEKKRQEEELEKHREEKEKEREEKRKKEKEKGENPPEGSKA